MARRFLFPFLAVLLAGSFSICDIVSAKETLKDYYTQNEDEKKIIVLVLKFQNGYSKQKFDEITSVYAPGALIKTVVDPADWNGVMLPKDEHAKILSKQMDFYKKRRIKLEIFPPKSIDVSGDEGSMSCPYELYSRNPYKGYLEEGVVGFEFKKTNTGWLISKRTWEITRTNYEKYNAWKRKQKK